MSEFRVEVIRVGPIEKHPNADTLGIARVHGGYPCIVKLGELREGDLAVYVPVDSVVPDDERWSFLAGHRRIKARRLRGVFSMGLLVPAEPGMTEGQDAKEALGITKYEPPVPMAFGGNDESDPGFIPVYTDVEGLRRWPDVLVPGEQVVITEKIHGENGRFAWRDGRLWCASHKRFKREDPRSQWWRAAASCLLIDRLQEAPNVAFYGEVHGYTGNFSYGVTKGSVGLRIFDALDTATKRYLDYDEFVALTNDLSLERVPELFRGPWDPELRSLAEGRSTLDDRHIREGIVVRPVKERWDRRIGRVILKLHGEGFLTHKSS